MARAFAVNVTLPYPPDYVWAQLTDWSAASDWMSGVDRLTSEGPSGVGTRLTFHARGQQRTAMITEWVPTKAVTVRSVQGTVTADYRYTLEPAGEAQTRVQLDATCTATGFIGWFGPLLRFAMRQADQGQLDALAAVLAQR